MKRGVRAPADLVTPELRAEIFRRDRGCVVARLVLDGRIERTVGPCSDRFGETFELAREIDPIRWWRSLTLAHVRDRAGGRTGKRPPSTRRRLAAVCPGHALPPRNVVDLAVVRPVVDEYLEELEGPEIDQDRPHERVRRVRARDVDSTTSGTGG